MKRFFIFIITLLLVLVQAETWTITYATTTPVSCSINQYSVERIVRVNSDPSVSTSPLIPEYRVLSCFNENQFTQAIEFMQNEAVKEPNVVVRHQSSLSPLKIVAADRAMAYSQNYTYLDQVTVNVTRNKELTTPFTYINQSNPLYFHKTLIKSKLENETISPSDLVSEISVNGARGFITLNALDIIPLIYVENRPANCRTALNLNWCINHKTRTREGLKDNPIRPNITQYIVSDVTSRTATGATTLKQIRLQVDTAIYVNSYELGLAPSWLPNGIYYSADGISFYTDMDLKNIVMDGSLPGKYYNYYNYLNLRSKTKYTGIELDKYTSYFACTLSPKPISAVVKDALENCTNESTFFSNFSSKTPIYFNLDFRQSALFPYTYDSVNNTYTPKVIGELFINSQDRFGMNALNILSMAIHESAYGTSNYARTRNNLFGYGAVDINPDDAFTYPSLVDGINAQTGINLRYYLDHSNSALFFSSNIGNKGAGIGTKYASDPWWSSKIASYAFKIDRYLGLKDFDNYQESILSTDQRSLYKEKELQNLAFTINTQAQNYPLIVESRYGQAFYTQSTNPILNGTIVTSSTKGLVDYNWSGSKVYINSDFVRLVNTPKTGIVDLTPPPQQLTDSSMSYVVSFDWINENSMAIRGFSALRNTNMALNTTTHELIVTSLIDSSISFAYPLEIDTAIYPIVLPNGYDYASAWFKGTIDIRALPNGYYKFEVVTRSGITQARFDLINTISTPIPTLKRVDGNDYRFIFNNFKRMSYELIKEKGIFVENQSPVLQSQFTSYGLISNFNVQKVDGKDILSVKGLALMQHINQGLNDNISHKLLLVNSIGEQFIYDLSTSTSTLILKEDPNFTYTHVWFENASIDVTSLPADNYRMYSIISNTVYTDVVELIDYAFIGSKIIDLEGFNYNLNVNNNVRKRFELSKIQD